MNLDNTSTPTPELFELKLIRCNTGRAGTTRAHITFTAAYTGSFGMFLSQQCDEVGIQGILGVFKVNPEENVGAKVMLLISNVVTNTENAAIEWIKAVNAVIHQMEAQELMRLLEGPTLKDAFAVSADGSNGTLYETGREDT